MKNFTAMLQKFPARKTPKELKPFVYGVKERYRPATVVLFGSRARGDARRTSDYDLLIVSPKFAAIPFYDRHVRAYRLQSRAYQNKRKLPEIDLICLTPEEFQQRTKQSTILRHAAQEGIELHL